MTKPDIYKERELLDRLSKGEEYAFRTLFNRYREKVYSFSLTMVKSEETAEEITQDVFVGIWLNREKFAAVERFDAYLHRIVRNRAFDHLRKMANDTAYRSWLWQHLRELHNRTEEDIIHKDYLHLLSEAVHRLPPQQQQVFSMRRNKGMTNREIASTLNISQNTVKNHMALALKSIKTYLNLHSDIIICIIIILNFFILH